jgi:hypothetical protein
MFFNRSKKGLTCRFRFRAGAFVFDGVPALFAFLIDSVLGFAVAISHPYPNPSDPPNAASSPIIPLDKAAFHDR